jgi:hypothetical protein
MIAAEIVVAFAESPGNRKAGNDRTRGIVAMRRQHRRADPIAIQLLRIAGLVERQEQALQIAPARGIFFERRCSTLLQTKDGAKGGFFRLRAKAHRQQRPAVAIGKIERTRQSDVAVRGKLIFGP